MRKSWFSAGIPAILLLAVVLQRLPGTMAVQSLTESRDRAAQLLKDGNFAEALPLYRARHGRGHAVWLSKSGLTERQTASIQVTESQPLKTANQHASSRQPL